MPGVTNKLKKTKWINNKKILFLIDLHFLLILNNYKKQILL